MVGLDFVDDPLSKSFEEIELGIAGVTIHSAIWLGDDDRGQMPALDVLVKLAGVVNVSRTQRWVGHDVGRVLEGIANVAIAIRQVSDRAVPMSAVVPEGDVLLQQRIADVANVYRRQGEGGRIQGPVLFIAGVVVVQQVVMAVLATRFYGVLKRLQVIGDHGNAGLPDISAVAIGAAGVAVLVIPVVCARLRIGIFNLVGGRRGDRAFAVAVGKRVGEAEHNMVRSSATHYRLVHVV